MPLRCIFHPGMPKTGTSSIQESLYFGLRSPQHRYISLGDVTGDKLVMTGFATEGESYIYHVKMGDSREKVAEIRRELRAGLAKQLQRAEARRQTVVLSAESSWRMQRNEFQDLADFLKRYGYEAEVIAYLRPWKSWLESRFQQGIKGGIAPLEILPEIRARFVEIARQLSVLDEVFGRDRVFPVLFRPDRFPNRCVVQDFCQRAGLPFAPDRVRRVNEGLTMPATKLLYVQRRYGRGFGVGLQAVVRNEILYRRLEEVPGPPVRFHSSLVAPIVERLSVQLPAIEERLGEPFREAIDRDDQGDCLRDMSQMLEFTDESLEWLARATGLPRLREKSGEAAARAVAGQMQHLLEHPSLVSRLKWHAMIAERRVTEWIHDV